MSDFGVCGSHARDCSLSFERVSLDVLLSHIDALERHRAAGNNADLEIPLLRPFLVFFQPDVACSCCKGQLARGTEPTAELPPNGDEYKQRVSRNRVLEAGYRLQSLRVLPF